MYRLLTIFLGLPLMLFWGLLFGMYSFMMIWLAAPMRRLSQSVISEMGIYIQAMCDTIIGPIFRSAALIFSSVRLSMFRTEVHSNKEIHV